MSEKTEQLLQQLAEKLGTTTQYLWSVLVTQARYNIIVSVLQMAVMFAVVYWTIKLHMRFSKKDKNGDSAYCYDDGKVTVMIFAGITSLLMIVLFLDGFNDLIASIFNPEYWALKRLLHSI